MKKLLIFLICLTLLLPGCARQEQAQIAATTLPVWQFSTRLCQGTGLSVTRLVTESVSCLHDYSLTVGQMKAIEGAEVVILSGAGLEEFLEEALQGAENVIDSSAGIRLLESEHHHSHDGEEEAMAPEEGHTHEQDPHIWLDPENAMVMARNICTGLSQRYPEHAEAFEDNLRSLLSELEALDAYAQAQLCGLSHTEIITFHDGFSYLAEAYGIEILEAIEEESGAEASAKELIHLIEEVRLHEVRAIFVEINGSGSAASIISAETGAALASLDMAMSGDDYFTSMYANIDALREALQ